MEKIEAHTMKAAKPLIVPIVLFLCGLYLSVDADMSEAVKSLMMAILILVCGVYFGVTTKIGEYHGDARLFASHLRTYAKVGGWIMAVFGLLGVLHWVGVMKGK